MLCAIDYNCLKCIKLFKENETGVHLKIVLQAGHLWKLCKQYLQLFCMEAQKNFNVK